MSTLRYLLLQVRDPQDPMRSQEVGCFARAIGCDENTIGTLDLLTQRLTATVLEESDAVLIGGSGDYSAAGQSPWLEQTLGDLRLLHELRKPTFASCWGFQALARALGGRCIHDPAHAELGTIELKLTEAGRQDRLFGAIDSPFLGQAGHEDHVVELPQDALLLASSDLVKNQAFKFVDAPIYCTQFHPELDRDALLSRVETYPRYVERIAGATLEEFAQQCVDTPGTRLLLKRFASFAAELVGMP
ncbi:MAG: type 1 glutamine amidotransferase [Pirellulales bacterium]|nr:type 1 glutamine amidotransferase [Pirellulales bacterium]